MVYLNLLVIRANQFEYSTSWTIRVNINNFNHQYFRITNWVSRCIYLLLLLVGTRSLRGNEIVAWRADYTSEQYRQNYSACIFDQNQFLFCTFLHRCYNAYINNLIIRIINKTKMMAEAGYRVFPIVDCAVFEYLFSSCCQMINCTNVR